MADFNNVVLSGCLGNDPEMKYFESGKVKANFSLAVNSYNSKEKKEITDWFKCECWGKTAEYVGEHIKKGACLVIDGFLKTSTFKDENDKTIKTTYILIDKIKRMTIKSEA